MDLLLSYSSSSEDEEAPAVESQQPQQVVPPKMVGVAMPPPDFESDEPSPSPDPIPTDLSYEEDRALLRQLSSPTEMPSIPSTEPTTSDPPSAKLLAQFGALKSPSHTKSPVHFNQRLVQNPELARPGWLLQQAQFMQVADQHRSDFLLPAAELPSKDSILQDFYAARSARTKIEFTS